MKLIAMSDTPISTFALFSVDGEEMFLNYYKSRNNYTVTDKSDNYLDFSQEECKDVLVELKKQYNFGKEK